MSEDVVEIETSKVLRGLFQPRDYFDPEAMEATQRSIAEKGQKVPIIVRPIRLGNGLYKDEWADIHYELADGERRLRCCRELGFKTIKAIVRDLTDEEMLDYALTTNDSLPLNPIEKAKVFYRLANEFGKTQEEIAKSFNLKQQQVSEIVRLLELPEDLKDLTARAVITVRHARELLKISDNETIKAIGKEIADKKLSTREIAKKVKEIKGEVQKESAKITHLDIVFEEKAQNLAHFTNNAKPAYLLPLFWAIIPSSTLFFLLYMKKPVLAAALGAAAASILIFEKLFQIKK